MWFVIPLGIAFVLASVLCAIGVVQFMAATFPEKPMPRWVLWPTVMLALLVFFGAAVTQVYVLLSWLERLAARHQSAPRPLVEGIADRSLSRPHSAGAFTAIAIFLALPLVMFGSAVPSSGVLIGSCALIGMLIFMLAS
jgi:hypothetical protein